MRGASLPTACLAHQGRTPLVVVLTLACGPIIFGIRGLAGVAFDFRLAILAFQNRTFIPLCVLEQLVWKFRMSVLLMLVDEL